jgi:hypothetical protein
MKMIRYGLWKIGNMEHLAAMVLAIGIQATQRRSLWVMAIVIYSTSPLEAAQSITVRHTPRRAQAL